MTWQGASGFSPAEKRKEQVMMIRRGLTALSVLIAIALAGASLAREPVKPGSGNPEAQALIDKAWKAVEIDLTTQTADEAIKYYEHALKLDPDNPEMMVALADECWQRGDQMPRETDHEFDARNVYFEKGLEYAKKALEIKESAGAHYWYCANLASSYESRSAFAQAGIFLDLNRRMEWIQENEITYLYGGYARFWGQVLSRVPGLVIKLTGEDPDRVYAELENAIKIEPGYLLNYTYQGEFLHRMGKEEESLEALKKAIEKEPGVLPKELAKNKLAKKRALEDWKEFTGNQYLDK
jgi:tetratricopeptide (TPR) repeat protein